VYAVLYYVIFRFLIKAMDLKTPGREDVAASSDSGSIEDLPFNVLTAMGGESNIKHLDACITRLRVEVNDTSEVDEATLKNLGASGVMKVGNNMQAIFGTKSDRNKNDMQRIIDGEITSADETTVPEDTEDEKTVIDNPLSADTKDIFSPIKGKAVSLEEVPDQVFSEKMMGDGLAIKPSEGVVRAPFDGEVVTDFPTKHALGLTNAGGLEVLVHIGLDTVNLKGEGFKLHVSTGDTFKKGDILLEFDLDYIRENAKSDITPVIITGPANIQIATVNKGEVDNEDIIINVK